MMALYAAAPEDPLEDLREWLKKAQTSLGQAQYDDAESALIVAGVIVDQILADLPNYTGFTPITVQVGAVIDAEAKVYSEICILLVNSAYKEWHSPSPSKQLIQWNLEQLKDFIRQFRDALSDK